MKKRIFAAVLTVLMLLGTLPVLAQTDEPGRGCFSIGLEEIENAVQADGVTITARFVPESIFSAKKAGLSVLQALFERASVAYCTDGTDEAVQLCWDDAPVADLSLLRKEDAVVLDGSVLPFPIASRDEQALYNALGMDAAFAQITAHSALLTPLHNVVPAQSGAMTVTQDMLDVFTQRMGMAGVAVTEPVAVSWTVDEEGTLTAASVQGTVQLSGESAPWVIDLNARGSKAKLSVEGTIARDEDNRLDLAVSITYESVKATKKQKASHDVNVRVKVTGKLGGYAKTLSVTIKSANSWARAAETGVLEERIKQTVTVAYTDKNPDAAYANLSDLSVTVKDTATVRSGGIQTAALLDGTTDVLVKVGDYTLLDGLLTTRMRALMPGEGAKELQRMQEIRPATVGEASATADEAVWNATWLEEMTAEQIDEVHESVNERAADLMKTIYPTLSEKTKEIIGDGLK